MMQTILFEMRVPTHAQSVVEKWANHWGGALTRIALANRSRFSTEEIEGLLNAYGFGQGDLVRALQQGWIFARQERSLRPIYVIPDEVHALIRTYVLNSLRLKTVTRKDEPLLQRDETDAIVRDLHTLLDYVTHRDVLITTEGAMYKRHLQQLMELFEVSEDLAVPKWRFGYGRRAHDYPDRLALIYDFAYHEGFLIETDGERLEVSTSMIEWRELSGRKQLQRILNFYLRLYRKPIPRLREIIELMRAFGEVWISASSLLDACSDMVSDFYYDSREVVWRSRILSMLTHLGVLRMGQDEDSMDEWFQMTKLGQELLTEDEMNLVDAHQPSRTSLIVQPNFEIMVTEHDSKLEARLAEFSELKSSGSIRVYRILQRTVESGLESGHRLELWLKTVSEHSLGPIPGNVERTVLEWTSMFETEHKPLSS